MGKEAKDITTGKEDKVGQMAAIVMEYQATLLRYASRIVNNTNLAQDVVQNVFTKLFESWKDGARPSGRLAAWLYRVTHNEAVDFVRRESKLKVLHEKHTENIVSECRDGVHCPVTMDDRRELVLENIRNLHPVEQQIILLRMQEEMSYAGISEVTGRTEGNIGCILHNAMRKLARAIREKSNAEGSPQE